METKSETPAFDPFLFIKDYCLQKYQQDEPMNAAEMAIEIMDTPPFIMHGPEHHYLVPAVLLTEACRIQGREPAEAEACLDEAMMRAKNVLKAFCGLYGACGAAIGIGIFASVLTETTPYSVETWSVVNRGTAESLLAMAEIDGPRCCKRNTFLALQYAPEFSREQLGIPMSETEPIVCHFYQNNKECKKASCPFFPKP